MKCVNHVTIAHKHVTNEEIVALTLLMSLLNPPQNEFYYNFPPKKDNTVRLE